MEEKLKEEDFNTSCRPTWCPGCGDFVIWQALKVALAELDIAPHNSIITYGVGCISNMNNNIKTYAFHSLHGRAIPVAVGAKLANHKMTVLSIAGDGGTYGEGANHLLHASRYNSNITNIVANNHSYSLTTGQSSPTSKKGYKTKTTPWGEVKRPVNPISLVLSAGATFVARGFSGDLEHLKEIIKAGIKHNGFSHIDVMQQCVTFNKEQTVDYFRKKIYKLENEESYDIKNKLMAFEKAEETTKVPIGIFYKKSHPTYESTFPQLEKEALVEKPVGGIKFSDLS